MGKRPNGWATRWRSSKITCQMMRQGRSCFLGRTSPMDQKRQKLPGSSKRHDELPAPSHQRDVVIVSYLGPQRLGYRRQHSRTGLGRCEKGDNPPAWNNHIHHFYYPVEDII